MDNITEMKNKIKESIGSRNYAAPGDTEENFNIAEKYASTGESEFSREFTHPIDEVLSERHYTVTGPGELEYDGGPGSSDYERSDERVLQEANEILMRNPKIDPSNIELTVSAGVVTLSGTIPSREMKSDAERILEEVFGVKDVLNNLVISAHGRPLIDNRTGLN